MMQPERKKNDVQVAAELADLGKRLATGAMAGMPSFDDLMVAVGGLDQGERDQITAEVDMLELGADAYALGVELFERGDFSGAKVWLLRAAKYGHELADAKIHQVDQLTAMLTELEQTESPTIVEHELLADAGAAVDVEDVDALADAQAEAERILVEAKQQAGVILAHARIRARLATPEPWVTSFSWRAECFERSPRFEAYMSSWVYTVRSPILPPWESSALAWPHQRRLVCRECPDSTSLRRDGFRGLLQRVRAWADSALREGHATRSLLETLMDEVVRQPAVAATPLRQNSFSFLNNGMTVLVGANATGKSEMISALRSSFEDLQLPVALTSAWWDRDPMPCLSFSTGIPTEDMSREDALH